MRYAGKGSSVPTYLFAWNPVHWGWPELDQEVRRLKRRGHVDIGWASGRTRAIDPGSRAFMVRLGVPPKGIIGAGVTLTAPTPGRHWVEAKAAAGIPALYLRLRLEVLGPLPLVTFEDLAKPPYSRFRWGIRASGTRLPSTLADALEDLWETRVAAAERAGAKKTVRPRVKDGRAD
jgi:5-methylcytosine-specific restriction protein A